MSERQATWLTGVIVFALCYIWLAGRIPYNNTSVLLQWGLIALSGVVAVVVMFLQYLAFAPSSKLVGPCDSCCRSKPLTKISIGGEKFYHCRSCKD